MRMRFVLLGSLVSWVALAASPVSVDRMSGFGDFHTLDEFDARMKFLTSVSWDLARYLGNEPDPAGRTLQEDLDEFLLTDDAQKKLTALRATAAVTVDGPRDKLAEEVLQPLVLAIGAEFCRLTTLQNYWNGVATLPAIYSELDTQVSRLPPSQRSDIQARLDQINERSRMQRPAATLLVDECNRHGATSRAQQIQEQEHPTRLIDEYSVIRQELADRLNNLLAAGSITPESFERTAACRSVPPSVTGGPRASARRVGILEDYYPPRARNMGITGKVRVRMDYDTTGCITRVIVLATSASPDLDQAAIMYALEAIELAPAIVDGIPQAGAVVLPLTFSLLGEH